MIRKALLTCVFAALVTHPASASFAGFDGWWGGSGKIKLATAEEAIKCRSTIKLSAADTVLAMNFRCASTSYTVDVTSNLTTKADHVTGTWVINTHNINGRVTGTHKDGTIAGTIVSDGFTARVSVARTGNKMVVSITPERTSDLKAMTVELTRG